MPKVQNTSENGVLVWGLEDGIRRPQAIPARTIIIAPDYIINEPAPPQPITLTLRANGMSAVFPVVGDIDASAGVTVTLNSQPLPPTAYTVFERPGKIMLTTIPAQGDTVTITYSPWPTERYIQQGIILVL
jgi:hypothetical protein